MLNTNQNQTMEKILDRLNQIEQRIASIEEGTSKQTPSNSANVVPQQIQEKIVAVRKNEDGNIIAVKTETGLTLDYNEALVKAKAGEIAHVDVFTKYGREILRSEPDGIKENNLDELPLF